MAKGPFRVLEFLVTASPGGGPRHVWDLARRIPNDEFELIIGAPRDEWWRRRIRPEFGVRAMVDATAAVYRRAAGR